MEISGKRSIEDVITEEDSPFASVDVPEPSVTEASQKEKKVDREREGAPELSELVERIPQSNREALEELFRGKFVSVRKLDLDDLK